MMSDWDPFAPIQRELTPPPPPPTPPTKQIDFLELPLSARKEVLSNFDPIEIVDFSLCSKRNKSVVKQVLPKNQYEMTLNLNEEYSLAMSKSDVNYEFGTIFINQRQKYPEPMGLNTFQSVKLMKWTDYICDLFDTSIKNLHISTMHSIHILKDISSWIKNRQEIYPEYSEIESPIGSSNDYNTFLLENFNANNLKARVHFEDTYETNIQFTQDKLMLLHSEWFTDTNLLTSNCSKIELFKTKVTAEGINAFLKGWIKGDYPKLEYLILEASWENHQSHDGIEVFEAQGPDRHFYDGIFGGIGFLNSRKQIRRIDGKIATIEYSAARPIDPDHLQNVLPMLDLDKVWFKLIANSLFLPGNVMPDEWRWRFRHFL